MAKIGVSSHSATKHWLSAQIPDLDHVVDHIQVNIDHDSTSGISWPLTNIQTGDIVYGNLPIHLAAQVCSQGAEYFHLSLEVPFTERGKDLNADDLTRFGAKLERFYVDASYQGVLPKFVKNRAKKTRSQLRSGFKRLTQLNITRQDLSIPFAVLLTATGIGIFVDSIGGALMFQQLLSGVFGVPKAWFATHYWWYFLLQTGFGLLWFFAASWFLRHESKRFLPLRYVKKKGAHDEYKGLILNLSSGYHFEQADRQTFLKTFYGAEFTLSYNLNQDIEQLDGASFQQVLRILKKVHKESEGQLRKVCFVGTLDDIRRDSCGQFKEIREGSFKTAKGLAEVLAGYPEFAELKFTHYPIPVDANDIEAYYTAYEKIADRWQKAHQDISDRDILIDITGGKSLASVAAALSTLHNKMQFQYLDTNDPKNFIVYEMEFKQQDIN